MEEPAEWDIKLAKSGFSYIVHQGCPKHPDEEQEWMSIRNTICMWCAKDLPVDLVNLRDWRNKFYRKPQMDVGDRIMFSREPDLQQVLKYIK